MSARDGKDHGPEEPGSDQAGVSDEMLALLYGELDGESAARERARVDADPALAGQLAGLERVRDMFGSLEDEEPPARISAQLLAEAARAAPAPRRAAAAEGGIWARLVSWLQPVAQRPAFAAAASLVLVAGVAGVLMFRKGKDLTDAGNAPTAQPPAELAAGSAPAAQAPTTEGAAPATGEMPEDGDLERQAAPEADEAKEETKPTESKRATLAKGRKKSSSKMNAKDDGFGDRGADSDAVLMRPGTAYGLSEKEAAMDRGGTGGAPGPSSTTASPKPSGKSAAPPPPPVAAPNEAPQASAQPQAPRPPVSARDLHMRAVDSAADKRCSDVRTLADEVRAIDASYYKTKFVTDKRLTTCLQNPSPARNQTQQRK